MARGRKGSAEPVDLAKSHGRIDVDTKQRQQQAVALRLAGATFQEIADTIGYSNAGAAHKAVFRVLDRVDAEMAGELRDVMGARLERLTRALWAKALTGDPKAVAEARRLNESFRRLYGLDAPLKIEGVRSWVDEQIEALAGQLDINAAAAEVAEPAEKIPGIIPG